MARERLEVTGPIWNSHQFGDNMPMAVKAWLDFLVPRFLERLEWAPEKTWPKYGVG